MLLGQRFTSLWMRLREIVLCEHSAFPERYTYNSIPVAVAGPLVARLHALTAHRPPHRDRPRHSGFLNRGVGTGDELTSV